MFENEVGEHVGRSTGGHSEGTRRVFSCTFFLIIQTSYIEQREEEIYIDI